MTIRKYISAVFFGGFTILMALACADYGNAPIGPGGGGIDSVSFAADIRGTLIASCAKVDCHGSGIIQGGLLLGTVSWNEIINASGNHGQIIVVGNAAGSNLFTKITASAPFGSRMPQDGPPFLSLEAQTAIRNWIDQGALDN